MALAIVVETVEFPFRGKPAVARFKGRSITRTSGLLFNFTPGPNFILYFFTGGNNVIVDLGERGKVPLPHYSCTSSTTKKIELAAVNCHVLAVLLLLEHGADSGHFYQPDVNHRCFDPKALYDFGKDKNGGIVPPLLRSLFNPGKGDDFTSQTPFSVLMYEITQMNEESEANVDPATLIRTILPCKISGRPTGRGKLKGCCAQPVTMQSYKRLLSIFDFRPVGEDGEEVSDTNKDGSPRQVTPCEWASFFSAIGDIDMKTHASLRLFLDRHNVPGFKVDESLSMPQLRLLLSQFLRSITGIRGSAFDCQHRLFTMAWIAFGYFTPSNQAPLCSLKELTYPYPARLLQALGGNDFRYESIENEDFQNFLWDSNLLDDSEEHPDAEASNAEDEINKENELVWREDEDRLVICPDNEPAPNTPQGTRSTVGKVGESQTPDLPGFKELLTDSPTEINKEDDVILSKYKIRRFPSNNFIFTWSKFNC